MNQIDMPSWVDHLVARIVAAVRPPEPDYLDIDQLAAKLSVTTRTIFRLVKSGDLPAGRRVGSKVLRWRMKDVDQWLQSRPKRRVRPVCRKVVEA